MPRSNEDEAWRAIVENYGDRAELDPLLEPDQQARPVSEPAPDEFAVPVELDASYDEDGFVPPTPPPLPHVPRDRMLAWAGLFGSPTLLLAALVLGIGIPSLIGYLLVGSFIGGFVYLVMQMPRGPKDPWDDGARL